MNQEGDKKNEGGEAKAGEGEIIEPPAPLGALNGEDGKKRGNGSDQMNLIRIALGLEKERIESANRRTELGKDVVKAADESDKRQYQYQMERLHLKSGASSRSYGLIRNFIVWFCLGITAVVALFLYMMFWGDERQGVVASNCMKYLLVGGGGYGVISGISAIFRKLFQKGSVDE